MKSIAHLFIKTLFLALLIGSFTACQQKIHTLKRPANGLSIAFYNIENLFDTIDDPKTNDRDFLPDAKVPWNSERYTHKLSQISKVIAAMDTLDFPHVLGLSEIENKTVLEDLIAEKQIEKAGYEIIHIEDNDPRGIEVAMLFRPDYFKPVHQQALVHVRENGRKSRHILYVKGLIHSRDTLHLFVNHWTSRFGGQEATEAARIGSGKFLRTVVDSLHSIIPDANIVIMGDFNDNPDDPSMFSHLRAYAPGEEIRPKELFNLAMEGFVTGEGTLFYRGWDFFDQIIVSSSLLKAESSLKAGPIQIIKKDWMLFTPSRGEARPNRTQSGNNYYGGFSDHLPVMVKIHSTQPSKKSKK